MSRIDVRFQQKLLKEARQYYKKVKPVADVTVERKKGAIVLTQEHIHAWLEVFADDRIMLDGCNHATVKR